MRKWARTVDERRENMNNLLLNLYVRFQLLMDGEDGQDMAEYALVVALPRWPA
jgi:hypothetical protein